MDNPKVTVLMAVYNGEEYLSEAINSILNQTFDDFEFLIIDDGSCDKTRQIIESFDDPRIKLLINEKQLNLAVSLNRGLDVAKGEYIARMDADDISLPDRLKLQVEYMDQHPEIGVCGSWIKIFNKGNKIVKYSEDFLKLKAWILFGNIFTHPTVMMRLSLFNKYELRYNEKFIRLQDYELWSRAIEYFPMTNLQKVLLNYRANPNGKKDYSSDNYQNLFKILRKQQLTQLGIEASDEEINLHIQFADGSGPLNLSFFVQLHHWLKKIKTANHKLFIYPEVMLVKVIKNRLLKLPFSMIKRKLFS